MLDRLEIELADHGGTDNGKLPVTFDDFQKFGIHRHAIAPAIREAVMLGFIEVTEPGCASNAEFRSPNKFRITYRHTKNMGPTDEWRRIVTVEEAEAAARLARTTPTEPTPHHRPRRRKTETQCRETPAPGDGNRHRKGKSPVPETDTTGHGTETGTAAERAGRPEWSTPSVLEDLDTTPDQWLDGTTLLVWTYP